VEKLNVKNLNLNLKNINNTMYVCPICNIMPTSHSLQKIERNGKLYIYTCPSKAVFYNDVKGILHHYQGVLSEIPEDQEWIWIFDGKDFGLMHAMNTSVAIELARLISTYHNLKKIIIIHPTIYITMTHKLVMPFLGKINDLIEFNDSIEDIINV